MIRTSTLTALCGESSGAALVDGLFRQQRRFVLDPSPRKAALCSRRAGKSYGLAAWFALGASTHPGALSLYVAQSSNAAKLILWPALRALSDRHALGVRLREDRGQLMASWPNGHRLWLAGCSDAAEVDRFRGPAYRRAAIDEAQSYGAWLATLVEDVIAPALGDCAGELALCGTPGPNASGYYYVVTTGDGGPQWPTHRWTLAKNPHFQGGRGRTYRAQVRAARGWSVEHPTYQREWMGRWVQDAGALVYPYQGARNGHVGALPEGDWRHVLALDLGYVDDTAFAELAWRVGHPEVYVIRAWKRRGLIPSAVAAQVAQLVDERRRAGRPYTRVVADTGGLGRGYASELSERYGVAVEAAEKRDRRGAIEMMRGDLLSGVVRVVVADCGPLLDEWSVLEWDDERSDVREGLADHCSDAALYGFRACAPRYRPVEDAPADGTAAWWQREQAREREAAFAAVRRGRKRGVLGWR